MFSICASYMRDEKKIALGSTHKTSCIVKENIFHSHRQLRLPQITHAGWIRKKCVNGTVSITCLEEGSNQKSYFIFNFTRKYMKSP